MRRLPLLTAMLVTALALPPAAASAADETIIVGPGRSFNPPNRSIDPDDTVTWQYAAGSEEHHVASNAGQAESWNFGETASGTFPKTFTKSGAFSYVCLLHDEMRGTITVSGSPLASFTKTATSVFAEDATPVDFSSTSSDPAPGTLVSQVWDLDGDGQFDDGSGTDVQHTYGTPGTVNVRLRITDDRDNVRETAQAITVQSRAPTAALTAPASVLQNADVTFNASASSDADGTLTNFSWDLDNDGVFETDTGTVASVTTAFATTGAKTVGVQVTDNDGRLGTATRVITVNPPPPPPPPPGSGSTPPPPPPPAPAPPPPAPPAPLAVAPAPGPAVPAPAPPRPPALAAASTARPLALSAAGPRRQRLRRQRGVRVRVKCSVACRVVATGTLRVGKKRLKLKRLRKALRAGKATTLRLKLSARDLRRVRRSSKASITLTVTDAAGGKTVKRVRVSLRR
jgi:plastocyanin